MSSNLEGSACSGTSEAIPHYFDPTSTTIIVPSYSDSIIYMHALKVANPLSGCLFLTLGKRGENYRADMPGLCETPFSNKVYWSLAIL